MRFGNFHISKEILMTADLMNTVNGGKSLPVIRHERLEKNYLLKVKVPGVSVNDLTVEIKNNQIFINHKLSLHNSELYNGVEFIPYLIGFVAIPYDVNIQAIRASYLKNELLVTMPFNELSNGYYKKLPIE